MSTCHKGLWSYGLVMGQTGGVGYAGSWWLGGVIPPLGLDLGVFPCSTPSSITSCEGEGLPAHNHTVEAVASPTWTKRQGRTDKTTSESRGVMTNKPHNPKSLKHHMSSPPVDDPLSCRTSCSCHSRLGGSRPTTAGLT